MLPASPPQPSDSPREAAVRAVLAMRSVERLLASSGFYSEASVVRQQREQVEKCSATSVDDLRPDHGGYAPLTIGKLADEHGRTA